MACDFEGHSHEGTWLPSLKHRRLDRGCCAFVHLQAVLPSNNKPPEARLPIIPPPATPRPVGGLSTRLATETAHCHPLQLKSTLPVHTCSSLQGSYPDCIFPLWNSLPATILPARPPPRQLQSFKLEKCNKYLLHLNWQAATGDR